jgi:hypothetical protein
MTVKYEEVLDEVLDSLPIGNDRVTNTSCCGYRSNVERYDQNNKIPYVQDSSADKTSLSAILKQELRMTTIALSGAVTFMVVALFLLEAGGAVAVAVAMAVAAWLLATRALILWLRNNRINPG